MSEQRHYDIIVAGGGLAGLIFVLEAIESPHLKSKTILVVDNERHHGDDRTWSFWATNEYNIPPLSRKSWKKAAVIDKDGHTLDFDFNDYQYYTVLSSDFYNHFYRRISGYKNISFHYEEIIKCDTLNNQVSCATTSFRADLIVRSYYKIDELRVSAFPQNSTLWQHFEGWFIETADDHFDESRITLMDYRVASGKLTQFFYILPFSKRSALIEYTEFSNRDFNQVPCTEYIQDYITTQLNIPSFTTVRKERSSIPMTDFVFPSMTGKSVINIGTIAGYVKPSSGYCFTRSFQKVRNLIAILERGPAKENYLKPKFYFWLLDSILLQALSSYSIAGQDVFPVLLRKLAQNKEQSIVFKFLDERTSAFETLKLIIAMPNKLLLLRIFLHSLITGRIIKTFFLRAS
jgi:lycopene beta-cyclase